MSQAHNTVAVAVQQANGEMVQAAVQPPATTVVRDYPSEHDRHPVADRQL